MAQVDMTRSDPQTCEAKIEGVWRSVSLVEAKGVYATIPKRCPACHGLVMINGNYTGQGRLMLVHRRGHDGCPLLPARFKGTPSLHPQALS
jgi:hypothetical protein